MASYDNIPLTWNDPLLNGATTSGAVTLQNGGSLSYKSITADGAAASVMGMGSFTLDHVRIDSAESVRLAGSGNITISNSYLEATGSGADHADVIQAYSPGGTGNVTITNTTIVAHNTAATAGMFIADNYAGTFTLNNVVFEGGPFGLRMHGDDLTGGRELSVSLTDVYFIGPFMYDPIYLSDVKITHWENVRSATIVNGELVPGDLIPPPYAVEGGVTPPAMTTTTIDDFSTDSGIAGDHITNDNTPTLSGKAAANSTVKVFDGTTQIGTTTANSSGTWSYTSTALADGAHNFTAKATNSSGQTSASSAAVAVKIDTTAPNAPTVAAPTNNANGGVNLTGTAEANSTVKVFDGTAQIGTATANSNGAWSLTTGVLATGNHSITVKATDAAGNTGAASAAVSANIPSPTPNAPTISSFSNDSGVAGDKITNDNTLTLTGTAAANSTVKVFDGTTQIGTATANSSGAWNYTTTALADGNHNLTAKVTDASGNTSAASVALAIKVDTTAPAVPVALGDSIVNGNQVLLNGTAEANSTVKVYDGLTLVGTATAKADGTWSVTTSPLSTGPHDLTATATDVAGNTSAMSLPLDPVIGGPAPGAPTIASFSNDSGVAGDKITNDNTLTLTGTAAANSTVKVFDGTTQIGTATANSNGAWSYTTAALADGAHNLTAKATDAAGQTSAASAALALKIDTTAPNAPTVAAPTNNASGGVNLTGTAEANSTVKVFDGTAQIGMATANSNGAWSLTTGALATGNHSITAKATDAAGNTGAASAAVVANIPSSIPAPGAPTIASFSNDSGVAGDNVTNDNTLTLTGTAAANGTVKVFDGATQIGTATANSSGAWTYTTAALSDGGHNLTAKVTDAAGNTSAASAALAVKIDTTAPVAPTITSGPAGTAAVGTNAAAKAGAVTLTGTAEANSTVKVFDGATQIGTATADKSGAWSSRH